MPDWPDKADINKVMKKANAEIRREFNRVLTQLCFAQDKKLLDLYHKTKDK